MTAEASYSLEDAIAATKFGKFNVLLVTLSGLILACALVETSCVSMILPIAQCELDMTSFHKGLLGSVGYAGVILSSHFWGFMADTRGRKRIMVIALLLAAFCSACSTFSKNFWLLAFFRFLNGFCICGPQVITYAFLGEFHSPRNRARVVIVASIMYGIFGVLNPLNGMFVLNQESWNLYIPFLDLNYRAWRIYLLISSVPSVVSAIILILFIPESPKFTYSQGDESRTLQILQRIYQCNTGKSSKDFSVKSLVKDKEFVEASKAHSRGFFDFMWSQTVPLFKRPHLKNTLTACYLQFGICVTTNSFYTFYPEILNRVFLWLEGDPRHTTATVCEIFTESNTVSLHDACVTQLNLNVYLNSIMLTLINSAGWFIMSLLINTTGKLTLIVAIAAISGGGSILMMFIELPRISVYIYVLVLMSGLNMSLVNASTVELYPTNLRAMAVSISMMVGRIGSMSGSNFIGATINDYCTYIWILPAILMISGGLLAFTIPNINKREKK